MSSKGSPKSSPTTAPSVASVASVKATDDGPDEDYYVTPEFIYGGPFIEVRKPSPFIDSMTPMNLTLQGTFRRSFAYFSLKDRLPHILTKIIDYASREGGKIKSKCGASDADLQNFIKTVVKLKNDLVTNKNYDPFTIDTEEGEKWNRWIEDQPNSKYFTNSWVFTECYIYRRIFEACELNKSLSKFDYFEDQKMSNLQDHLREMCVIANKMPEMCTKTEDKAVRKQFFVTLLKICLWANKCDLSFSCGEKVTLFGGVEDGPAKPPPLPPPPPPPPPTKGKQKKVPGPLIVSPEPFQMVLDLKERLVIDESNKIADQICNKAAAMAGKIAAESEAPPTAAAAPAEGAAAEEPPKIPCPSKMVTPNTVTFDIVCDNAGYELFADMCFASFLLEQEIVKRVRFHVKKMPWFISDATPKDFQALIDLCKSTGFSGDPYPVEAKPVPEGEEPPPAPAPITSAQLNELGKKFQQYVDDGRFLVLSEDFWTYPIVYRDMKAKDYYMYRKLQFAVGILFKGDLNYRKLMGDRSPNPYSGFEVNLQGFIPAPIIAARTVKSETICGMPKGKFEVISKVNEQWMTSGDYGLLQFCPKAEALKVADRPCWDYGETCYGVTCPEHMHDL